MSKSIFHAKFGQATGLEEQAKHALTFLIKNNTLINVSDADLKALAAVRSYSQTIMTELYNHLVDDNKLGTCYVMDLSKFAKDIPEILANDDICIDGKALPDTPAPFCKAWINITSVMGKRSITHNQPVITDTAKFNRLFVRGVLCMSYNDSDMWLDPKLAAFIIESYSMTAAMLLQRSYNLNPEEFKFVQTLFATYYAQLCGGSAVSLKVPPLLNRCGFLGSMADIGNRLEMIEPYRENEGESMLSIQKIISLLTKVGPPRMHEMRANMFFQLFAASTSDSQAMSIALDYPPYWVYQMLKTLSGEKNPMLSTIFKMSGITQRATQFAKDLNTSSLFINKVNR